MTVTIDNAGRLVIPKEIRDRAGIEARMDLEIRYRDGRIEIEPSPLAVRLARKGRLLVAMPKTRVETLTAEAVEATRRRIRRERSGSR